MFAKIFDYIAAKNPSLNKKLQANPIFLFPMGIT